jgi:hypothetical protein
MSSNDDKGSSQVAPGSVAPTVPAGRARRRVLWFVAAALSFQLIVPLTYYLRDDPYDERFAWRMFSAERMHVCTTKAVEVVATAKGKRARPIPLESTLHQAWLVHLRRNRRPVVHRFLRWRCEGEGVTGAGLVNRCQSAGRTPLEGRDYTIDCASGAIRERVGPPAGAVTTPGARSAPRSAQPDDEDVAAPEVE